jgi:hypothetical protein
MILILVRVPRSGVPRDTVGRVSGTSGVLKYFYVQHVKKMEEKASVSFFFFAGVLIYFYVVFKFWWRHLHTYVSDFKKCFAART